ncbi:MAG: ABC transporter permease subunit [Dorea sp.]|nr:ABC transporter permease subunit [Dorea sp.]
MKSIIRFEIDKVVNNLSFLVTTILTIIIMSCVFFVGFYYSQLNLVEKSNEAKGVDNLYWEMAEEYRGEFSDQLVNSIMSDYIHEYQTIPVEKRPFNLFASNIADVFFPKGRDVYIEMNDAVRDGKELSIDEIDISSIKDIGFANFSKPLILGNYVPWFNFFKVSGYIFMLASMISIIISSLIFSNDSSKKISQLLFTTRYGRNKLVKAKIGGAIIINLLIFLFMIVVAFIVFLIFNHGISGWDASIQINFCMNLYNFSLEINNFEIWLMLIFFYFINLLVIIGASVFVSSLCRNPVGALLISLGIFFLPLGLTYIFKQGLIGELLYLFPINNFDIEKILSILSAKGMILHRSVVNNYMIILGINIVIFGTICMTTYARMKNIKNIS